MTSIKKQASKYLNKRSSQEEHFEQIKNFLNYDRLIDDLGLETVEYRGELWCSCPLPYENHLKGDRNPSFSINVDNPKKLGLWNCFICGGGNIINLISLLKGITYSDAEVVARQYLTLSEENFVDNLTYLIDSKEEDEYNIVMPEIPEDVLHQFRFIHPWMRSQGLTDDAVKHFQIGYHHRREGIVFPHWWNGKLVGYQIRDLSPNAKPKYTNTHGFPRRNTLFHFDCECIKQSDSVIVVESPKSAVKLWGLGFKNVIATFGAEITPEQMAPLWSFEGNVYLWFDNDPAGAKAYKTASKYLRGIVDLWLVPPLDIEKGDPGDLDTSEEVNSYLEKAKSIVEVEL